MGEDEWREGEGKEGGAPTVWEGVPLSSEEDDSDDDDDDDGDDGDADKRTFVADDGRYDADESSDDDKEGKCLDEDSGDGFWWTMDSYIEDPVTV